MICDISGHGQCLRATAQVVEAGGWLAEMAIRQDTTNFADLSMTVTRRLSIETFFTAAAKRQATRRILRLGSLRADFEARLCARVFAGFRHSATGAAHLVPVRSRGVISALRDAAVRSENYAISMLNATAAGMRFSTCMFDGWPLRGER